MNVIYSPRYEIDIGRHVFPTVKYRATCERLLERGLLQPGDLVEPEPASWDDLALVHTAEYLGRLGTGTLSSDELSLLDLPWSAAMVDGFRTMVGGTVLAATMACGISPTRTPRQSKSSESEVSGTASVFNAVCHIGGGLHHAFPNHGEGFCPFNDVAVAIRVLQRSGVGRVAVVDLDVHHGNGTAFIFESDPRVFTFSMHQQYNYPLWKPRGSLDIGLTNGMHDAAYLAALEGALPAVLASAPQCIFYLAGADPYEGDQLGGLNLTREGLRLRDRLVILAAADADIPIVLTLAGGYARDVDDTVAIHVATVEEASARTSRRS